MSAQLELVLAEPDPLEAQWAANRAAQAHQWTPEALCRQWATGCDDIDWWNGLQPYERAAWMNRYQAERDRADSLSQGHMTPARFVVGAEAEVHAQYKAIAESWAAEIREAFLRRKPCPIIPEPGFAWLLAWAFQIAQVPGGCLAPAPAHQEAE